MLKNTPKKQSIADECIIGNDFLLPGLQKGFLQNHINSVKVQLASRRCYFLIKDYLQQVTLRVPTNSVLKTHLCMVAQEMTVIYISEFFCTLGRGQPLVILPY